MKQTHYLIVGLTIWTAIMIEMRDSLTYPMDQGVVLAVGAWGSFKGGEYL